MGWIGAVLAVKKQRERETGVAWWLTHACKELIAADTD